MFLVILAAPVLVFPWLGLPIWGLFAALHHVHQRAPRRALVCASAPILAILIVVDGRDATGFLRFRLERADYLPAIESARSGGRVTLGRIDVGPPSFAYFDWGGMIRSSKGIAYDETDEASKPEAERSDAWRARHKNSELYCDSVLRPLGGHFYLVYAGC